MNKKINKSRGFTLIELIIVMVIIGILAAIVLMQMRGYAKDARASKAQAQMSSVIPSMIGCWGNGGTLLLDKDVAPICSLSDSYGNWPIISNIGYRYAADSIDPNSWYISLDNSSDDKAICCNKAMNNCKILDTAGSQCNATTPSN